jgi:hypothetical protein
MSAVGDARLDVAHVRDVVVLNHIDEGDLAVVLNGRGGNQRDVLQRVHQQPRVDELVGKERAILVVEERRAV